MFTELNPVKNYRRGIQREYLRRDIAETPTNRRRSVHFMGVTRPRNGRDDRFWTINTYVYGLYTYVTVINMGQ